MGLLVNYCLITFPDNTEVAYLKTLTKEDIIKFYKVSSIHIFRFWLIRKYDMFYVVNQLTQVLWKCVYGFKYFWHIITVRKKRKFILNPVQFSSPSEPGTTMAFLASWVISLGYLFVCVSVPHPAHKKTLLSLSGGKEKQGKQTELGN